MKIKSALFVLALLSSAVIFSQQSGVVEYTEIVKPVFDMQEIEGLPPGMDLDLSAFMPDSIVTQMTLNFNSEASLYSSSEVEGNEEQKPTSFDSIEGDTQISVSIDVMGEESSSSTYHEKGDSMLLVQTNFMGQEFLITKKNEKITWKFHPEKINYLGYECSKATTMQDSSEVVVWYTSQVPTSLGPGEYSGLPGLILMVSADDGNYQIKASKIDLTATPKIKEPKKGKKVNQEEFMKIQEEKAKEMMNMYGGGSGNSVIIMQD